MKTYLDLYQFGKNELASADVLEAEIESKLLLFNIFDIENDFFLKNLNQKLDTVQNKKKIDTFKKFIHKRIEKQIPISYLTREKTFFKHSYQVDKGVLIPRPETELLVELIYDRFKNASEDLTFFEIGAGTGIISIELSFLLPKAKFYSWEISKKAYKCAVSNAKKLGVTNVELINEDFFRGIGTRQKPLGTRGAQHSTLTLQPPLPLRERRSSANNSNKSLSQLWERVNEVGVRVNQGGLPPSHLIIIGNPPYIAKKELKTLAPEILLHEPLKALDGGKSGLIYYKKIIKLLKNLSLITKKINFCQVFLEIGYNQKPALIKLLEKNRISNYLFYDDFNNLPRILEFSIYKYVKPLYNK